MQTAQMPYDSMYFNFNSSLYQKLYLLGSLTLLYHAELSVKGTPAGYSLDHHSHSTTEEISVVSLVNGEQIPQAEHYLYHHQSRRMKPTLKLLLYRSSFFIVGVMLLIAGGVASQYHPSADYSDCDGSISSDNLNASSIYYCYTCTHTAASPADPQPVLSTSIPYVWPTAVVGPATSPPLLHPSNILF